MRRMMQKDLHRVNMLLSRSFTQGRIDDGYQITHVPMCRPEFLELYFSGCPDGCFVLEDAGQIQAAAFCHIWGKIGWIGPLAVIPEQHLLGLGKKMTVQCMDFLKKSACTTIGLETSPRSNRNIGFYGKLGFLPKSLSIDVIRRVPVPEKCTYSKQHDLVYYSRCSESERNDFLTKVRFITKLAAPAVDYSSLINLLPGFSFGETLLFLRHKIPIACAILQTIPTSAEEKPSILRSIAFVAHPKAPNSYFKYFIQDIETFATELGLRKLHFRLSSHATRVFNYFLANNFRIIHTDLRMTLANYPEQVQPMIFHMNRWA